VLKNFDQCDNVASKFIQRVHFLDPRTIKILYINIVALFNMLNCVDNFLEILHNCNCPFFVNCFQTLSDKRINEVISGTLFFLNWGNKFWVEIQSKLHIEPKTNINEKLKKKLYYLVKNDSNEYLDLARIYYTGLTSEIYHLHKDYQRKLQGKDLQLIYQESRGYCLSINQKMLEKYSIEEIETMLEENFVCTFKVKLLFWELIQK